jgi:hypothetical protein
MIRASQELVIQSSHDELASESVSTSFYNQGLASILKEESSPQLLVEASLRTK